MQATNSTKDDLERALDELLYLVELIDNANDLHTLGGLKPLLTLIDHSSDTIRAKAVWCLGVSASNNLEFQETLRTVSPIIIGRLTQLLLESNEELVGKALYTLSSLLRGHERNAVDFFSEEYGGIVAVAHVLEDEKLTARPHKKCLQLLSDMLG